MSNFGQDHGFGERDDEGADRDEINVDDGNDIPTNDNGS